jgi:hypothetical protein
MAHLATDLSVTLPDDRPGMLARAIKAIGAAGVNIDGYAEMGGVVRVLTTDSLGTRHALERDGFRVTGEQQVCIVDVADRPGAAGEVFQRIADAGVNISFSYLATHNRLVVGANDVQAVLRAVWPTA